MTMPVSGLCRRFRRSIYPAKSVSCRCFASSGTIRIYRTVRACKSTGAPESTAAGKTSPGSLPSIILFGIGEKLLSSDKSGPGRADGNPYDVP